MAWGTLSLLAGPNGAGKSTLVASLEEWGGLVEHVILNTDDRTLEKAKQTGYSGFADTPPEKLKAFFFEAADEVVAEAMELLKSGRMVSLETVLSTDKYREMVNRLLEGEGTFQRIYVALKSSQISRERVSLRVQKGGHDVPTDRLEERWKRSLEQLKWFILRATRFAIYDNSEHPSVLLAAGERGRIQWQVERAQVFPEMLAALEEAFKDSP